MKNFNMWRYLSYFILFLVLLSFIFLEVPISEDTKLASMHEEIIAERKQKLQSVTNKANLSIRDERQSSVSQVIDISLNSQSENKTNELKEFIQNNKSLADENNKYEADKLPHEDEIVEHEVNLEEVENAIVEEDALLNEQLILNPEGITYTDAELNEIDPETIRLIQQEHLLADEELSDQQILEEEINHEEMERDIAEEEIVIEEKLLTNPEGIIYTEAQINDLDPETLWLIEQELEQVSGN